MKISNAYGLVNVVDEIFDLKKERKEIRLFLFDFGDENFNRVKWMENILNQLQLSE